MTGEAARRDLDPWQIAREEEQNFKEDSKVLRIRPAAAYPRATEHVPEMIAMIEALIEKGHAYEVGGNVYFDATSFPASNRTLRSAASSNASPWVTTRTVPPSR